MRFTIRAHISFALHGRAPGIAHNAMRLLCIAPVLFLFGLSSESCEGKNIMFFGLCQLRAMDDDAALNSLQQRSQSEGIPR